MDKNIQNIPCFCQILLLFLSFCMISSSVYILNDLNDIQEDRLHPYKKMRPIAAGIISSKMALFFMMILLIGSAFSAVFLSQESLLFVLAYFGLNVLYTYILRNVMYADVFCIATGFILRLAAAFCLLNSPIYISFFICIFFCSCFFTCIKRKLELRLQNGTFAVRKVLNGINQELLNKIIWLNAVVSIFFFLYFCVTFYGLSKITVYPIVLFYTLFLLRIIQKSKLKNDFDDPINFLKKDKVLQISLLLILLIAIFQ